MLVVCGCGALFALAPTLAIPPRPAPADAIVSLGGESPSRVLTSVELYNAGFAREIWFTGDVPPAGKTVSLAESDAYIARQNGVPNGAIYLLPTTSTWEDAQQIAAFVDRRGSRSVLVVTSWYHSRRALCAIEPLLNERSVAMFYQPAELPYTMDNWWRSVRGWRSVTREVAATGYYIVRYGTYPWTCSL